MKQMAAKVAERLQHDPIKLRFTTTHLWDRKPDLVLKRSLNHSIQDALPSPASSSMAVVLYERLGISVIELETEDT
jgi:ubiquitin carboxyl-terminal hydrolase 7